MKTRSYTSPLRAEQTRQTRRRILDAAHSLLLDQGYAATTMTDIAKAAAVSAQTVYNAFGTKSALVKGLYDVVLVGDDAPATFAERSEIQALRAEQDPHRLLLGYAAVGRSMTERLGPLLAVLTAAAGTGDPELQAFVDTISTERLNGTMGMVRHLAGMGALADDLTLEDARDAIWALNSVEVWSLLVGQRGWTGDQYAKWVGQAMACAVLTRTQNTSQER